MEMGLLIALAGFAFVTSITPGPNNLMLMASGANYGVRRTVPHMLGVAGGFALMIVLIGFGLIGLFDLYPRLYDVLKAVSIAYLLYLAWKIATAAPPEPGSATSARGRPFTFLQAASFQWVNPKAWTMALTALTVYAPGHSISETLAVAAIFGTINLPSVSTWTLIGQSMRKILTSRKRLRAFNLIMALALVATLYPVVMG